MNVLEHLIEETERDEASLVEVHGVAGPTQVVVTNELDEFSSHGVEGKRSV